jgi:hypothetical protein
MEDCSLLPYELAYDEGKYVSILSDINYYQMHSALDSTQMMDQLKLRQDLIMYSCNNTRSTGSVCANPHLGNLNPAPVSKGKVPCHDDDDLPQWLDCAYVLVKEHALIIIKDSKYQYVMRDRCSDP